MTEIKNRMIRRKIENLCGQYNYRPPFCPVNGRKIGSHYAWKVENPCDTIIDFVLIKFKTNFN